MKRSLLFFMLFSLLCFWGKSYAEIVISQEASYTTEYACYDLAVSPDGNTLYSAEKGTATILTLNAKTLVAGSYLAKPATGNTYGGCVAVDANGAIYGTYVVISGSTNVVIYKWANNSASPTVFKDLGAASTYFIDNSYRSGYGMDVRVDANGNGFLLLPVPNNGSAAAGASVIYLPISNNVAGTPQHVVLSSTNWGLYPKVRIISDTQFWYDGSTNRPYLVTIKKANDGTVSYVSSLNFPYKSDPAIFTTANGVSDFSFKGTRYAILGTNNHGTSSGYVCKNRANLYTISVGTSITATTKCYLPGGGMGETNNTTCSVQSCVWNNGNEVWMYTSAMGAGNKICAFRMYDDADPTTISDVLTSKTIRRSVYYDGSFYVLAVDGSKNPYLYKVNADTEEIEAVLPTDFCSVSDNGYYKLSDIAITDDGVLVGCNNEKCTFPTNSAQYLKFYKWDLRNYTGEYWFSPENVTGSSGNPASGNFSTASSGATMAYSGTMTSGTISWRAQTLGATNGKSRYGYATIVNGSPTVAKRSQDNTFMNKYDNVELTAAPTTGHFIFMSDTQAPIEYSLGTDTKAANEHGTFATAGVHGISFFSVSSTKYMVVPSASDVKIYNVTSGLGSASLVETLTYNSSSASYRYAYGFKDGDDFGAYLLADGTIAKLPVTITADGITLDKTSVDLPVGGTVTLIPTITPAGAAGNAVTWSSNNTTAATVASGVVTAKAIGVATITAEVDGQTATCTVNVCAPVAHILPYDLRRTLNNDGLGYTFSFKSNIAATSGKFIFYQAGVKKGEVTITSSIAAGENSIVVAKSALPQIEGAMTWAVELTGADSKVIGEITNPSRNLYNFYMTQGVAIDNSTESNYFGNIYVTAPANGASDGLTERSKNQKAGLFVYDPLLNELNEVSNQGYTLGLSLPAGTAGDVIRHGFKRVNVDAQGNVYVNSTTAIYKASPADLTTSTPIGEGLFTTINSFCIDDDILYVMDNGSSLKKLQSGTVSLIASSDKLTNAYNSVVQDGHGGWWISQNRSVLDTYYALCHVNADKSIDFSINQNNNASLLSGNTNVSTRGNVALNPAKDMLVMGSNSSVIFFDIAYDGNGTPTLTKKNWTLPTLGTNIDGIAFDYAGNLFVVSSSTERMFMYALPTAENKTLVPAKSTLTVDAQEHIAVTAINLSQTSASLEVGSTLDLTATFTPANATDKTVEWHSDNTAVAEVNPTTGRVTAVSPGTAHITAVSTSDEVESEQCTVSVYTLDFNVTWNTNGASSTTTLLSSNADLWSSFMSGYNTYYMAKGKASRAERPMTEVVTFAYHGVIDLLTDPSSPWRWFGTYINNTALEQSITLSSESEWTNAVQDFFSCTAVYVDFTTAGQISEWLPLWKAANNYLPLTMRAEDEMPTLVKGNDCFVGWYDNSSFTGDPVTSVTHDITLYAKWVEALTLNEESTNATAIADHHGITTNVTLQRTFSADVPWYTLVLPFDVSAEQMQAIFGSGYRVAKLEDAYMKTANALLLRFADHTAIEAGVPCLFHTGQDINEDIVFHNVTIDATDPDYTRGVVTLHGLYDQTTVEADEANFYLGTGSYLYPYSTDILTNAFRAYFDLSDIPNPSNCSARIVFQEDAATELDETIAPEDNTVQKVIRDGQLLIIRNGQEYTIDGRLREVR